MLYALEFGWGGRIRTSESRFQRPVSYRLTTPQSLILKIQNSNFEIPAFSEAASRRQGFRASNLEVAL